MNPRIFAYVLMLFLAISVPAEIVMRDVRVEKHDTLSLPFNYADDEITAEIRASTSVKGGKSRWMVTLADTVGADRVRATVSFGNINDDPFFRPYLCLEIDTVTQLGKWENAVNYNFTDNVELYGGANSLIFSKHDNFLNIGVGGDLRLQGLSLPWSHPIGELKLSAPQRLQVEYVALVENPSKQSQLKTRWTESALNEYLAGSTDPLEGYWKYLDRNMDARWARLGGFYRVAIVKNPEGDYDILYMSGAENRRSLWLPGMLKGSLSPTKFQDHYDVEWINSNLESAGPECSASLSPEQILTINLPLHHSVIRFVKE